MTGIGRCRSAVRRHQWSRDAAAALLFRRGHTRLCAYNAGYFLSGMLNSLMYTQIGIGIAARFSGNAAPDKEARNSDKYHNGDGCHYWIDVLLHVSHLLSQR